MVQVLVLEEQEEVADNGGGSWNQGGGSWSGGFPGGQVGKFFNCLTIFEKKTSQELRMLSRALTDCKSLFLNIMIQVSQFVSNSQLCH